MSEKHKHKDKKRKENGEDDKEAKKKHKKNDDGSEDEKKAKADKKEKKEKDKEKKKEKKEKKKEEKKEKAKENEEGAAGQPPAVQPTPVGDASKLAAAGQQGEKKLKSWQDDELEVESGDEGSASTKLQTLSSVAAQSVGQGAPGSTAARVHFGGESGEEADTLDTFMLDIAKAQDKRSKDKSKEGAPVGKGKSSKGIPEGVSVMDASRVKTITLEEVAALMSAGASASSSSTSKPSKESAAPVAEGAQGVDPPAVEGDEEDEEDAAFHAAFMAQMRTLRGEGGPAREEDVDDGSVTGEEWDEERTERERKRHEKRLARWKAQDEKGEGEDDGGGDSDDSEAGKPEPSRHAEASQLIAAGPEPATAGAAAPAPGEASQARATQELAMKGLSKKEKRRLRREAKQKEAEQKEQEAEKRLAKLPAGMKEVERLESDPEASEDSEMEKEKESYFELVKRFTTKKTLPQVDHSLIDYKPFTKNLYVQVKEVTAMKEHEVDDFRRTNGEIHVRGKNCPRPIKSFLQCGLPEKILKLLEKRDCTAPFPIQMQAIPALMCGRDIIGVAQTGSGKTMAYLLPLVRHALAQQSSRSDGDGPVGFIVAPTRELALQIQRECNALCKAVNMTSVCAFGGGPMGEQLSALKKGCEILVGTPGRLIDVLTTSNGKITNLRHVTFLVLDEADRMFDMGFEPQIGMFLQTTRPDKQVAMLSATLPTHVEALARQCLKKPIEITVGERNTAAINVTQFIEVLEESQKFYRLLQILGEWHDHGSVIVFVHQQKDVDEMFTELLKFGYPALALHGGQDQHDRDFTLQDFKDGVANILVATSVAARGLDVKKVILVVNFKVPDHLEDYIHRIGRTGRAGKPGFAYTFIQPDEGDRAQDMLDALRQCGQQVPEKLKRLTEEFQSQVNRGEAQKRRRWGGFGGKGFKYDSTEKSRQQKDRLKAKKDGFIGDEAPDGEEEEEFRDAWNEDKPLSAAAAKEREKGKTKGKGKGKGKGKDGEEYESPLDAPMPKSTGDAAAQIAAKLKAEVEAKEKERNDATQLVPLPGASSAAGAGSTSALMPPPPVPGAAFSKEPMADEDIEAQAQQKAEEVLKNLPEEQREAKLPKLKEQIKAKLVKAHEAAADASAPGMPPPPPVEETPLMKATKVVPGVLGAPTASGSQDLVHRSIMQLQDGILNKPNKSAQAAEAEAARLMGQGNVMLAPGMHMDELEINDYPQIARQKISHKDPLLAIEEMTGSKVQVRGQYFAPNAKIPEGARRLYVEVIGPTAVAVQRAKHEVHQMMEALAIRTLNIPGVTRAVMGTPGRYDPAVGK